jgi:NADH-quinone oxidoreductase subunit L
MNLFAFSMLMLVLGENLLVTFLGWEGVGTCSYLLVSFWQTRASAATAGKKAFVTNRVGDFGFMLAMFLAFESVGSISYSVINHSAEAGSITRTAATGIAALLFLGATGKSAQLPLYFWLPDAMEGPTPVSALIHAATMVTAGVFLMVRINPLLAVSAPWLPTLIAWIGVITALFAATIAVAQTDIKKVLAYSTVSQLGYMFLAVGSGAYVAAVFHMITHAFFKALLFLGSGSVIHGMHDEQDMRKMGRLRVWMPVTAGTFIVGWLAIAGVPPLAGFWSKDEILAFSLAKSPALYAIGLFTGLLTAYYMTRQVILVFFGKARWESHAEEHGAHGEFKPHESPPVMLIPLVVLAGLSIIGGFLQLPDVDWVPDTMSGRLQSWLEPVVEFGEVSLEGTWAGDHLTLLMLIATTAAILGIVLAYLVYEKDRIKAREPVILLNGWYYDRTVSDFMGGPGRAAFEDAAWFDQKVIDGAVTGSAKLVRGGGGELRKTENGYVRTYAGIIGVAAVLVLAWFVVVRGMI